MKISKKISALWLVPFGLFILAALPSKTFGQDKKDIVIDCPGDVQIGFKNAPSGWNEGLGGGYGATARFSVITVEEKQLSVMCWYGGEENGWGKIIFTLSRPIPKGYKCYADRKQPKSRSVLCKPIPIINKK